MKRLYRSRTNSMIAGVCAGIGEYFNVDPTVIRVLWALTLGAGLVAYILAWLIVPVEPRREA